MKSVWIYIALAAQILFAAGFVCSLWYILRKHKMLTLIVGIIYFIVSIYLLKQL